MNKSVVLAAVMVTLGGTALAQENPRTAVLAVQRVGPTRPGKVISKSRQPVGTPHPASSFAPHRSGKRVFGAPIQKPIMHSQPPPKPK